MTADPLLLRALRHEPVDRPPVWMMRQAGRYLSEYRLLKEKHGFLGMCRSPELATEITLQPLRALRVDAAIIFSDILLPAAALGISVDFNPGPKVHNPIRQGSDVKQLNMGDVGSTMSYVGETLGVLRRELAKESSRRALIGFAGAPFTLACYLLDQGPFKHFQGTQVFAANERVAFRELMVKLTRLVTDYLQFQIESGAEVVQLFDTWGGNLSEEDYRSLALPHLQEIFQVVGKKNVPMVLYVNGSSHLLSAMAESGATCLSVDWRTDLAECLRRYPELSIQGNFDPTHLFLGTESIASEARAMVKQITRRTGYVANLGHGVLPTTPRENAAAFVESVCAGW